MRQLAKSLVEDMANGSDVLDLIASLMDRYSSRMSAQPRGAIRGCVTLTFYPADPKLDSTRPEHEEAITTTVFIFPHGLTITRVNKATVHLFDKSRSLTLRLSDRAWRFDSPKGFGPNQAAGTRRVGATADPGRS